AGSDAAMWVGCKEMPTAGATGNIVTRQTTKGGDPGRYIYFAIKAAPTGNSYYDSISLGSSAAISLDRSVSLAAGLSLGTSAACGSGPGGSVFSPQLSLPSAAAISLASQAQTIASIVLQSLAAISATGGMVYDSSSQLSSAAAISLARSVLIDKGVVLAAGAGIDETAILTLSPSVSFASVANILCSSVADVVLQLGLQASADTIASALMAIDRSVTLASAAAISPFSGNLFTEEIILAGHGSLSSAAQAGLAAALLFEASAALGTDSRFEGYVAVILQSAASIIAEGETEEGVHKFPLLIMFRRRRL
ncbi:MAG: hypothetical protein ABIK44_06495, partial [candidate division WOR-3 bacterium]